MRYLSETVLLEVFTAGAADAHGNPVESWAAAVSLGVYAFNPGGTSEPLVPGHDRVVTTPTLYVPSTATVNARDRVTVRGVKYEVDGDALEFRNPYDSRMNGKQINLKVVAG